MAGRYGHAWVSNFGPSPSGLAAAEWRDTLRGITREMLRTGFAADALRADEFPPSSTRFRALCFGIPTFAAFRHEMTHAHVPRSAFGIKAWEFVDPFRMRQADQREADRIARDAYELAKDYVMRGGELPEVHAALRAPLEPERKQPAPPEVAKAHLDAMAKMLDEAEAAAAAAGESEREA